MAKAKPSKPQKETCEIIFAKAGVLANKGHFVAEVIRSDKQRYFIAMTEEFYLGTGMEPYPTMQSQPEVDILDNIVQQLLASGWQTVPVRGGHWWSKKFERRLA